MTIGIICPILGIFLSILYFSTYRRPFASALLCGISFSAFFYGYIADVQNDIYRHMGNLKYYQNIKIWQCFNAVKGMRKASIYVWDIWCWIIAQFNNPYLMQSSGALLGYTIITFIVFDYAKKNNSSMKEWLPILLMLYCVISPAGIVIGIRNSNALLLCALSAYFYYIKKLKNIYCISIIIIAVFIHHSVALIFLLWLLEPLYRRKKKTVLIFIGLFLFLFNNYGSYFTALSSKQFVLSDLVTDLAYSANNYQNYYHLWSFSNIIHVIVGLVFTILLLFLTHKNENCEELWNFCLLIFFISSILTILLGVNGTRYLMLAEILLSIILLDAQENSFFLKKNNFLTYTIPMTGIVLIIFYLNTRDLAWGTASFESLLYSGIVGYFSRL